MPTRRPRSGPHRDERARLAVLHAADDLLVERGFRGLTMEAIAARAEVSKQTIYRWWPSKAAVLLDTLVEDGGKRLPVQSDDVAAGAAAFADFLATDDAGRVLLALLAEAQHDPTTAAALHERFLAPLRNGLADAIDRATTAGTIAPGMDARAAADALLGPLVFRALAGAGDPRPLVAPLVEAVLRPSASP